MSHTEIADEAWLRSRGYFPIRGKETHWRRIEPGKPQVCACPGTSTRHQVVTQEGLARHVVEEKPEAA